VDTQQQHNFFYNAMSGTKSTKTKTIWSFCEVRRLGLQYATWTISTIRDLASFFSYLYIYPFIVIAWKRLCVFFMVLWKKECEDEK